MLTGYRKKLVKEVISYFIDTTGLLVDNFILLVQRNGMKDPSILNYNEWLAIKSFKFLEENDIILSDCFEFRNLANQLKQEKRGININSLWKKEIAKCIKESNIEDFTLLEVSDKNSELQYLSEKLFYTINCDENNQNFYNTFDFDSNNLLFLRILPKEVRNSILYKTPLFINFNPFLEKSKEVDNILEEMRLYGFNKKLYKDMLYVGLFRIIKLCQEYNLKDVRIGFYSSLDMFYENPEYLDFYRTFKNYFKFNKGICFNPKSVGLKSKSKFIGYMIWDLKKSDERDIPIVLNEKIQYTNETIVSGPQHLLRGEKDSLYDWVSTGISYKGSIFKVPIYLNIQTKSNEQIDRYENILGYLQNTKNLLRSFKKVGAYNVPIGEFTEITEDNFFKSIASFVVRSCLKEDMSNSFNQVHLNVPDMEIEGYKNWLADAIIYFTFSPLNMIKSYREIGVDISNYFFPLSFSEVHKFVIDENVINDMNTHNSCNLFFLNILNNCKKDLSDEGKALYSFCKNKMIDSLRGKVRENIGYKDSLVAWDAGFYQIRGISELFTPEDEDKYNYLLSKLQDKLNDGIYKYGFISEINSI